MTSVLLIGLDPSEAEGVDPAMVKAAIAMGQQRFEAANIAADSCLVRSKDREALPEITEALGRKPYACVVIGGGLRKSDATVELFEQVIAAVRVHAPQAAIAFNTNPMTSLDAVLRAVHEPR